MQEAQKLMLIQTLRKTPLFAKVPPPTMEELAAGCVLRSYEKGEYLFHEGQKADGFYVVHSGAINVHRISEDGKEQVIRVFYPGESFGEIVLVENEAFPASAKTTENAQVILIPTQFFRQQIQGDPDLALRILASMSMHLRYLVETIEDLKLKQAESRVAQWLIRQFELQQQGDVDQTTLVLPLPKHTLASQLGITSETLSRVFAKLRSEKIISMQGKEIHFESLQALLRFKENFY